MKLGECESDFNWFGSLKWIQIPSETVLTTEAGCRLLGNLLMGLG